jgi:hypothetical protein
MAVSDQFRASLPEDTGGTDAAGEERKRKDEGVEGPGASEDAAGGAGGERPGGGSSSGSGTGASASGSGSASAETPRRRSSKKAQEDTEALLRRLEQAGFSRAEAARLIFERMRPREEGLVRS